LDLALEGQNDLRPVSCIMDNGRVKIVLLQVAFPTIARQESAYQLWLALEPAATKNKNIRGRFGGRTS